MTQVTPELNAYFAQFYCGDDTEQVAILGDYPRPKPGEERQIYDALPGSISELASQTGIHPSYVAVLLRKMQQRQIAIYSGDSWEALKIIR